MTACLRQLDCDFSKLGKIRTLCQKYYLTRRIDYNGSWFN